MTGININPKIDFVFRKLFGSDENKDLLISLINSVVEPELFLTDVTIKNPFNLASYRRSKQSILDIKAKDQNGVWYDIEIQLCHHIFYGKRSLFYLTKLYVDQLPKGENYSILNTSIGIHFLDFDLFKDDRMLHQFVFMEKETKERSVELDHLRLYFVEMGKFRKEWPEVSSALDRWVAFLNRAGELSRRDLPSPLRQTPTIIKAVEQLEQISLDPKERAIYEGEEKKVMIGRLEIESAKTIAMQEGRVEGIAAGREEGRVEGRVEGIAAGRVEGRVEGIAAGREEGLKEGRFVGRKEGMESLLSIQLRRRFSTMPVHITDRLDTLTVEQMNQLAISIFDMGSLDDLEHWLEALD